MAAKVIRVAIGRLHNLGNYEHIRYDVTVELNESEASNPGEVINKLERLLGALAPIKKDFDYQRAVEFLSDPQNANRDDQTLELYKKRVERFELRKKRRTSAIQAFADLGV